MHYGALETFAVGLLTILNPVGNAAIFAGMTRDCTAAERTAIAWSTSVAVAILLLLATWIGEPLLGFFGISLPVFEVAGGLIVLRLGLGMLRSGPEEVRPTSGGEAGRGSIAVVPLAVPMLVGPGAMTTVIIQTHKLPGHADAFAVSAICLAMASLVWVCLRAAAPVSQALGADGMGVMARLMGIVQTSIAVGMVANGAQALFPGLS